MADMKAAALKAWVTRREKYGETGLQKSKAEKPNCKKAGNNNGKGKGSKSKEQPEIKADKKDS